MIVNLHGLGSIGENTAYRYLKKYLPDEEIVSPNYTVYNFEKGMKEIESQVDFDAEPLIFFGSSTGALFAEALAEKYNGQVVLINPVSDIEQIRRRVGRNKNHYTGKEYEIKNSDLDTFPEPVLNESKDIPRIVFYEKHDDTLNHELTEYKYKNSILVSFNGSSHMFEHWDEAMGLTRHFIERIYM